MKGMAMNPNKLMSRTIGAWLLAVCCCVPVAGCLAGAAAEQVKKMRGETLEKAVVGKSFHKGFQYLPGPIGNPSTQHYEVSPGHPPYEQRARFLGVLRGSWYEIGHQVGTKAGDLVRWVSDVWWKQHTEKYGLDNTMKALPLYEAQIAALNPELIQFMKGIAKGAEAELDKSPYARSSSHYEKVLNTNIFDAWSYRHPTKYPWTPGQGAEENGCSAFVTIGTGPNKRDEMIAAHNRHTSFNPKCYQLVYIGQPDDGNAFWVLTAGAAGAACQVVNEKGVSLILNAGGDQHAEQHANAFGVSWFLLFLHVAAYADTADQAIEMLTRGTPDYRARTGRQSLLRTGTWNFLISDRTGCTIVETTADRYAMRRPGDLGEIGDYLVMTNHNYCNYSFDENNRRTDVPMTRFGNEKTYPGSAKRFWTLMGDIRHHYGRIDSVLAMQLLSGHHQRDRDGRLIESRKGEIPLQYQGDVSCPHLGGYPGGWKGGAADAKVAVHGEDLRVYWTLGRPCEWQGPWDEVRLKKKTADILIAYDSLTGNTERMAQAVAEGVKRVPGAVAMVKRVSEVTKEDLEAADAIVLGCPTYYANIPGGMKTVMDDWSWKMKVDFTDKVGGAFATGGGQMGGKEHVVISLLLFMINNRMVVAGPLYQDEEGQDIWAETGAGAMTGPIDPGISPKEFDSASRLGERVARLAVKLSRINL